MKRRRPAERRHPEILIKTSTVSSFVSSSVHSENFFFLPLLINLRAVKVKEEKLMCRNGHYKREETFMRPWRFNQQDGQDSSPSFFLKLAAGAEKKRRTWKVTLVCESML